jgi:hypothetical protein
MIRRFAKCRPAQRCPTLTSRGVRTEIDCLRQFVQRPFFFALLDQSACFRDQSRIFRIGGPFIAGARPVQENATAGMSQVALNYMLAEFWLAMEKVSLESRLSHVRDQALSLPHRAVAAVSALGIGSRGDISRGTGGLEALLTMLRELEAPEELVVATGIAAARTREKITAMVPLIWLAARQSENRVCDCSVPHLVKADDVPLYALDKHTRSGREAIWRFACENDSVRDCLAGFVALRPASQITRPGRLASGSSLVQRSFTLLLCLIDLKAEQKERDDRVVTYASRPIGARHRTPRFVVPTSDKIT